MFGSVFRMQPKSGKKQDLLKLFSESGERDPRSIKGFIAGYAFDSGDEVWGVAIFDDEKSYRENANDPAQDREYRTMRDLLAADPEWHDGEVRAM